MASVEWSSSDWENIQEAARSAYEAAAAVRAVLPAGPKPRDPYFVSVPQLGVSNGRIEVAGKNIKAQKPTRMYVDFQVAHDQLGDIELIMQLARKAGQSLAGAEGIVLARGKNCTNISNTSKPVVALRRAAGLERYKDFPPPAPAEGKPPPNNPGRVSGKELTELITEGITNLQLAGFSGPFALLLPQAMWVEFHKSDRGTSGASRNAILLGPGGQVAPLTYNELKGADLRARGYLVAAGSRPVDLVEFEPLHVAFLNYEAHGSIYRVQVSFVLRVIDPTGLVDLNWIP